MILYLCIGILLVVFGVAVACLSMLYKWRRGVMGLVSTFFVPLPVMLGLMLIACTAVESEKEVEQQSVATKVIAKGDRRSLEMANGDIVDCQPDHQACLQTNIGDLVTYRSKWHTSGMWIERREVILVSHPEQ